MTQERAAVVTGAGRGIGAAIARALAEDGWRLVLVDRCADDEALPYSLSTEEELRSTAADCDAAAVVGDVREPGDLDRAVDLARERYGGLDAAIAAAGVLTGGPPLWEQSRDVWRVHVDVNLTGVFNLAQAAIPVMLERPAPRHGRFVAIASAAATSGNPRIASYNASKAGVLGLIRGLAADLGGQGITANAVCPGSTRTALLDASASVYDLADAEGFAAHHLDPRLLGPEEIAAVTAWLCSAASSAITGAAIEADAGMSAS